MLLPGKKPTTIFASITLLIKHKLQLHISQSPENVYIYRAMYAYDKIPTHANIVVV